MKRQLRNEIVVTLLTLTLAIAFTSAAVTGSPYISKDIGAELDLVPSEYHKFSYVRVYQDDDEVILYGKVEHLHKHCNEEGHVDLAVMNAAGEVTESLSLMIIRQGSRLKGWRGAHFRVKLDEKHAQAAGIRLQLHDAEGCRGPAFDCGANKAAETR